MLEKLRHNLKLSHYVNYILVLAVLAIVIVVDNLGALSSTNRDLLIKTGYYAIMAISLNLIVGFLGELSLGHAALMCVGAYAGGLVAKALGALSSFIYFPLAIIAGAIVGAIFGGIMGLPSLRLRGDYVAIITLAMTQIIKNAADNLDFITGGASGLKDVPRTTNYINCFIVLFLCLIVVQNFVKSKHGRAVTAIRDNAIAANACGINVNNYKVLVFTIAGALAGVGGVLATMYRGAVYPNNYTYNESINILVMVVLGGMGNLTGSLIAAAILTFVPQYLKVIGFTDAYRMVAYAVILIVMMILNNWAPFKRFKTRFISKIKSMFTSRSKRLSRDQRHEIIEKNLIKQVADKNENEDVLLSTELSGSDDRRKGR